MKLFDAKKVGLLTGTLAMVANVSFAAPATQILQRGLVDWVSLVAEILSFVCLAVFILYTGKFLNTTKQTSESGENAKVTTGIKNGIMTALVGIGVCQAVIIVLQAVYVK